MTNSETRYQKYNIPLEFDMRTKIINFLLISALTFFLSSCTLHRYQIRNELGGSSRFASGNESDIKYSLSINSATERNTGGIHRLGGSKLRSLVEEYKNYTEKALTKGNYTGTYTETSAEADLVIKVERFFHKRPFPQEWLTGLSLGIIPSWVTLPKKFVYIIENKRTNRRKLYRVDEEIFNHIIVLPLFWINFFTWNDSRVYKRALEDFIR
jgi:hypothetical protein